MPISTSITVRDGNNAAQTMASLDDLAGNKASTVSLDSGRQVYRAAANFTPQPTAAVTMITITGSATKTVRVKRIGISGVSTGSAQQILSLQRVSSLGVGGTLVAPTVSKLDVSSATATAVINHWTTTLKATGVIVGGPISTANIQTVVTAVPITSPGSHQSLFPEFGAPIGQAIVLRGTGDILEVQNIGAANLGAGTVYAYFVEWEEDAS